MKKILFTGGGSAGHVIPNVALIEDILAKGDVDVCYMGTAGIEKSILAAWKIPYYTISCPKLIRGGGLAAWKNNLKIPRVFYRAVKEAEVGLKLFQPDVVFSKGGFVSLPVVFAAKKLKIPCIAHESDLTLGLANRLSAKKCKFVFTSFPETANKIKNGKYGGAPIRRKILQVKPVTARRELDIPKQAKVLLIFGGGSGSRAVNEAVRKHLHTLAKRYLVLHVCGKGNTVKTNIQNYRQFEFVADMGSLYAAADLVLSRAGAGTVFELMALKKPSLLVPLEGVSRGDQLQNAEYFAKRGLCRVLRQTRLDSLVEEIDAAFADGEMRKRLQESHYAQGNARIVSELYALLHRA